MLPRVDSFRAGHDLAAIEALAGALAASGGAGDKPRLMRLLREHDACTGCASRGVSFAA